MTNCTDHDVVDIAVIGAGPAGISAGLYGARAGLKTIVFGDPYEGQLARAGVVENFITWTESPSGLQIVEKMVKHVTDVDCMFVEKQIKQIIRNPGGTFHIFDEDGDSTCAYTVILATGTKHKKLGVKGEEEFYAKGVGYCTICDGPFFRNQPVAIVGFGDEAVQAALRMTSIASHVNMIGTKPRLGADPSLIEELEQIENVSIYRKARPLEIHGGSDGNVAGISFRCETTDMKIDVNAVFIEVGVLPSSALASGLGVELDGQFIWVDRAQETNVAGFYAAGDITGGIARQAIVSAGDGARAAISAIDYIKRLGVSVAKLKTTQWGATKEKKPETKVDVVSEVSTQNMLYDYVHADEGFTNSYERYTPDIELINKIKEKLPKVKLITVSAHWCPDCRRNVPRMARISNELPNWNILVEDRDTEGVREKYHVRKIPTFILQNEQGEEIGRIIEQPRGKNLEQDLLMIVEGNY
ncbi:MAG: FAD-dependent oxidoreductase [Candidatus Kariarchaeaceae archaeon]|jgi:thioredoxin reductase